MGTVTIMLNLGDKKHCFCFTFVKLSNALILYIYPNNITIWE